MTAEARGRWVPGDLDLHEPVLQPPKAACKALIERVLLTR